MKKAIKKVVSILLSAITLSTCVAFPASVTDAATVKRNTPHIHGQFVYHKTVTDGPYYSTVTDRSEHIHPLYTWYTYDCTYCRACDGLVSKKKIGTKTRTTPRG